MCLQKEPAQDTVEFVYNKGAIPTPYTVIEQ